MRKYEFDWKLIGDIPEGRPNLGPNIDVGIYRLMQFTFRDILERNYGKENADMVFFEAGKLAGKEFFVRFIAPVSSVEEFVQKTQRALRTKNIGILRIEEAMLEEGRVILTIDEDLECSGLPNLEHEICIYDEGFLSALFEEFTQKPWVAKEIDCWGTGARTCRFLIENRE